MAGYDRTATVYKATDCGSGSPGTRIEIIVAGGAQELVDAINARLALGWRVLLAPVTRPDGSEWVATILFARVEG